MPIFYLAWVNEGVTFSAGTHATTATKIWDGAEGGEIVFSLEIEQSEGEFPSLRAELKNPRVGLLSAGRNQWIWLSADSGAGAQPLFNGRIVGVPQRMADEVVEVEFVARPPDFIAQKAVLAESLRVLPWFDRVWLQEDVDEDDTVLEARTARWHIDRLTLTVTASDIIAGEDGTIEVGEGDHFYDEFDVSYADAPLRRVSIVGTVSWTQTGSGDVDLTRSLHDAFLAVGNPFDYPVVASLTGEGFLDDWPEIGAEIGGGWTVGAGSSIEPATWLQEKAYVVQYTDKEDAAETLFQNPDQSPSALLLSNWANWEFAAPLGAYLINFVAHFEAARERSETVTTTIEADVQPLLVDPGAAEEETIELASALVGEPIDPDAGSPGAFDLPIGDLRRNSYFKTDRGAQSFEYLLLLARAKLLSRARAVQIRFATPWAIAADLTCRHSIRLIDNRLPGGEATGKVTAYTLSARGDEGEIKAEVTIGCTIGYGVALGAAAAGTPTYVNDNYVDEGYQQETGGQATLIAGELLYEDFDNLDITDDDGVDLLNMTRHTVVNSVTVTGGPSQQRAAIDAALDPPEPDPVGALRDLPTEVTIDLVPVEGGAFHVPFALVVSALVVPQSINLEAA